MDPLLESSGLRWIDALGLGLVALFLVLGALRGLWWQVVRLLGLACTIAVARALAPRLAPGLSAALPGLDVRLATGLAWVVLLAAGLALVAFLGRIGKASIEAAQLGPLDRAGGAVAGALSGVLVHLSIVLAIALLGSPDWARATLDGTRSGRLVAPVGRGLPAEGTVQAAEPETERQPAQGR